MGNGHDKGHDNKNGTGLELYAVIRLKGSVRVNEKVRDTLEKLHLKKVNNCILVQANETYKGMLRHAVNYVTWGEINEQILAKMLAKRGRSKAGAKLDAKLAKAVAKKIFKDKNPESADIMPVYRLSPPTHGLRSVKLRYPQGDMGARGEKINDLLLRMI